MQENKKAPRAYADDIPVYCSHDEIVNIYKVTPNPKNPNSHPDEQVKLLARVIKAQGWRSPVTVSNRSGFIVRGHGRLLAAKYNKSTVVPVDFQNYENEAEEWADLIADNRLSELSEIDEILLAELMQEIGESDIDFDLTGYTPEEYEDILNKIEENNSYDDEYDVDQVYEEIITPRTRVGDIFIIDGKHRLMCGDSTSSKDTACLMNGEYANLILTDPPYNVNYEGTAGTIINDNMSESSFEEFLKLTFGNMIAAALPGAAAYIFHADGGGGVFRKTFTDAGFLLKQCLIWKKHHFVLGRQDYHWVHEPILYGWKEGAAHYFTDERFHSTVFDDEEKTNLSEQSQEKLIEYIKELRSLLSMKTSVIEADKPNNNAEHPTMKPIPLIAKLIFNSSKKDWLVADFFGGSGSTLIAAEQLGRRCNLMEFDPKFCDVILKRYISLKEKEGRQADIILIRNGKEKNFYME